MDKINELYNNQKDILDKTKKTFNDIKTVSFKNIDLFKTSLKNNKNSAEKQIDSLLKEMDANIQELLNLIKVEIKKSYETNKKIIAEQERNAIEHIRDYRKQCDAEEKDE